MPLGNVQAAVVSLITAIVGLVAAFAIIDEHTASVLVGAAAVIVPSFFLLANAIIHHGETPVGVPPTKTLGNRG